MNDNQEVPNPELREHVTNHSFVLALSRSHIFYLEHIVRYYTSRFEDRVKAPRGSPDLFVPAAKGLARRGLIKHKHSPNFTGDKQKHHIADYYRLTKAGWAVYDLLTEAGLVVAIPVRSAKRRLAA